MSESSNRWPTPPLLRGPLVVGFVSVNIVLAAAHLIPPSADSFQLARVFLAVARFLQGIPEFVSFSILVTMGLFSPLAAFLTISLLAFIFVIIARSLWRSGDELREILPAIVVVSLLFGVGAAHAGDLLVASPVSCTRQSPAGVSWKVVTYFERGWDPGAVYFLLETDRLGGDGRQVEWTRLDQPIQNACDVISEIFPSVE